MELHFINPHIRFATNSENAVLNDELHYCYDCRLFYIKEGEGTLKSNGRIYNFSKDTVIYVPPGTGYNILHEKQKSPLNILIFNFDLVDDFAHIKKTLGTANENNFNPQKVVVYDMPSEFEEIIVQTAPLLYENLKKCTNEFLYKDIYYRETASTILKSCLIEILRKSAINSKLKIVSRVTEYIHSNYNNSELTNDVIAAHLGYHPYYLSQVMKRTMGETLHSYLLHYRIRVAKDFLITTDFEINTIAWKCGFNSTAYFIKQFKLRTGITPYQFRKANINLIG